MPVLLRSAGAADFVPLAFFSFFSRLRRADLRRADPLEKNLA